MSRDTAPEVQERHDEAFLAMGSEGRIAFAAAMSETAFELARDGIRMRHPDYTDHEVELAELRLRLGDDLFHAAYPDAPALPT